MASTHWSEKYPDPVGTGIIQEYGVGGGYVYDQIAPTIRVSRQNFQYATRAYGQYMAQNQSIVMAPNGPMNQVATPGITYLEATTQRYGVKDFLGGNEMRESMNPAADEADVWRYLMQLQRVALEIEFKAGLDAASNADTMTGTEQWNNAAPTIELTIDNAKAAFKAQSGFNPNVALVSPSCWEVFKRDTTLRELMQYTNPNILDGTGGFTPTIFGLNFVVPNGMTMTSNEGATAVIANIWADDKVYLLYVDKTAVSSKRVMTAAWFASQMNEVNQQFMASSWPDERGDVDQQWYGVSNWYKLIVESALVYRLDDVLA